MLKQKKINPTADALAWEPQVATKRPAYIYFTGRDEAGIMTSMDNQGPFAHLKEGSVWQPDFFIYAICMLQALPSKAFPRPDVVNTILADLLASNPMIDPTRLYGLGFSAGAETLAMYAEALPEYAKRFAALVLYGTPYKPLGYYKTSPAKAANLDLVPLWFIHNGNDDVCSISPVKEVYALMKAKGRSNVAFTTIPDLGHGAVNGRYNPAYQSPITGVSMYKWCQKYSRPEIVPDAPDVPDEPETPIPAPAATIVSIITTTVWSDGKTDIKQEFK